MLLMKATTMSLWPSRLFRLDTAVLGTGAARSVLVNTEIITWSSQPRTWAFGTKLKVHVLFESACGLDHVERRQRLDTFELLGLWSFAPAAAYSDRTCIISFIGHIVF